MIEIKKNIFVDIYIFVIIYVVKYNCGLEFQGGDNCVHSSSTISWYRFIIKQYKVDKYN